MAAELLAWIDSTSTQHNLDGSSSANPRHVAGRQGFYMPPIAQLGQRTPLQPGEIIRYTDILPRIITVPLLVKDPAGSEATLRTQMRNMIDVWFANPGTFRSTDPSGVQRDLNCSYLTGMELDENLDSGVRGAGWAFVRPQFEAGDPFWYDTTTTTVTYTGPFSPAQNPVIVNNGGYACWPIITVHGPGSGGIVIQNLSLAGNPRYFFPSLALISTDVLVIDTTPGKKSLILNSVTNEASAADLLTTFWPLATGNTTLQLLIPSGSTGATTIKFDYKQRYRSI